MATRKKKAAEETQPLQTWPKVTQGNHLTVTEYQDGRTTLEWDDEALLEEVKQAFKNLKSKSK